MLIFILYQWRSCTIKGDQVPAEGWDVILNKLGSWAEVKRYLFNNTWIQDSELTSLLEPVLMKTCAHYLYKEKRRGTALCNVGMC